MQITSLYGEGYMIAAKYWSYYQSILEAINNVKMTNVMCVQSK